MMFLSVYLFSAVALGTAATPSADKQRFFAFQDRDGFQWSTPMAAMPITAECGDGQTMVIRDIQGDAQLKDYQLSVVFCHDGDPSAAETQSVLAAALANLRSRGAETITDAAQLSLAIALLQSENSSQQ